MRIVLAGVIGAIVLFVWGFVSWMALGWHNTTGGVLPDEPAVVQVLKDTVNDRGATEPGVYWIPGMADMEGLDDAEKEAAVEAWGNKHREGPLAMLVYRPTGREPMDALMFVRGFVLDFLAALLAALLLAFAAGTISGYVGRVAFVTGLGMFVAIYGEGMSWNYFGMPNDWSLVMVVDHCPASTRIVCNDNKNCLFVIHRKFSGRSDAA
ncbi:MAG: hypothetical protein GY716_06810 [bacterium]|nr:hypothetical protein [bacterium]